MRVLDGEGVLRGTAFAVLTDAVITCDHVVAGVADIRLQTVTGADLGGVTSVQAVPEMDLAVLTHEGERSPLAVAPRAGATGPRYWAKGFHRTGPAIVAAFPLQGAIVGTTDVRYSTGTRDYEIRQAVVLRDDVIAEALSGAPVLDPETGAVIAVVNARLDGQTAGGFAVPLSVEIAPMSLRAVLTKNARTVESRGRHLNIAGAAGSARMQVAEELARMRVVQGVDLQRRVPRSELVHQIGEALAKRPSIIVVVGGSGVGKSTELAALAVASRRPAVLIRGVTVRDESGGVSDEVARELTTAGGGSDTAAMMASSARELGGLVVVVDGINESELFGAGLDEWLAASVGWLETQRACMVVSTRPEYWSQVEPLVRRLGREHIVELALDVFSADEQRAAAALYGVEIGSRANLLRRPITMRLYAELDDRRPDGGKHSVSTTSVIEAFVRDVARRVAGRIGSQYTADVVVDWIIALGARQLTIATGVLDGRSFAEVIPAGLGADELLRQEGLVARVRNGFRFTYDEVGDWAAGHDLDVTCELNDDPVGGQTSLWRRVGAVISALLSYEDREGAAAVGELLAPIVDRIPRMTTSSSSRPFGLGLTNYVDHYHLQVLEGFLARTDDATHYLPLLQAYVATWEDTGSLVGGGPAFWVALRLPARHRLALLRSLVVYDDYWGWRVKDWLRGDLPGYETYSSAALTVAAELDAGVLSELAAWLDDSRPLEGGEATVALVAMGIVYRRRTANLAGVWRWLADHGDAAAALHLTLVSDHSAWFIGLILAHADPETDALAVARSLTHLRVGEAAPGQVAELLGLVRECMPLMSVPEAVLTSQVFIADNTTDAEGLSNLVQSYREGSHPFLAFHLVNHVGTHRELVGDAFREALNAGVPSAHSALGALGYSNDASFLSDMDDAVAHAVNAGMLVIDSSLALYVEARLRNVGRVPPGLRTLFELVVQKAEGARITPLTYGLTDRNLLQCDPTNAAELIRFMLDHTGPPYYLEILAGLLRMTPMSDAARSIALATLADLDSETRDRVCIRLLSSARDGVEQLVELYPDEKLGPPGKHMTVVLESVRRGIPPTTAARELLESLRST